MSIRTKDELLESFRAYIGDRDDDSTLTLLEDMADTLADMDAGEISARLAEAEQKLQEQDTLWRKRYRDRFYGVEEAQLPQASTHRQDEEPVVSFESLFKED